jgi:hypothetical protein
MEQIYELTTPTIFGATYKLSTLASTFVFYHQHSARWNELKCLKSGGGRVETFFRGVNILLGGRVEN